MLFKLVLFKGQLYFDIREPYKLRASFICKMK